jgi:hypothetical protein
MATEAKSPKAGDDSKAGEGSVKVDIEEGEEVGAEGKAASSAAGASMARKRKKVCHHFIVIHELPFKMLHNLFNFMRRCQPTITSITYIPCMLIGHIKSRYGW